MKKIVTKWPTVIKIHLCDEFYVFVKHLL